MGCAAIEFPPREMCRTTSESRYSRPSGVAGEFTWITAVATACGVPGGRLSDTGGGGETCWTMVPPANDAVPITWLASAGLPGGVGLVTERSTAVMLSPVR